MIYRDEAKYHWSVGHNLLSGITLGQWWKLLCENRFDLDFSYAHRVAFLTAVGAMNSVSAVAEELCYGRQIRDREVHEAPLFILGHWRSGTTHLHNLISQDADNFAYPNTYQAVNPLTFLTTESLNSRLFARLLPATRPMDNMAMTFQSPQEDEIGLCVMSLKSPYLAVSFPRRAAHYREYLSFRGAADTDAEQWKEALELFMRKVSLVSGGRPLVIKSPTHTARIRHILALYPKARFLHVHRDPYTVFQSSQHYYNTAAWYVYLQRPDLATLDEQILQRYDDLFDAFFEDRPLIPEGQFHEIRFTDLEARPLAVLRESYEALGIAGFERALPGLEAYLGSLKSYRKNRFGELSPALRQAVAARCARSFDTWGYPR